MQAMSALRVKVSLTAIIFSDYSVYYSGGVQRIISAS